MERDSDNVVSNISLEKNSIIIISSTLYLVVDIQ